MRPGFFVVLIAILLVGFAAFFGGRAWARHDADRQTANAVALLSSSQDAQALFIVRSALEDLENGKPGEARLVLLRYAKLKASSLTECSKEVACVAFVGKLMPAPAELAEIAALKESK
jgi:predicted negative regulator of RcsB-dependent stress response